MYIAHGEAVGGQGSVETLQGDTALGMVISFFRIDLLLTFVIQEKKGVRCRSMYIGALETRQKKWDWECRWAGGTQHAKKHCRTSERRKSHQSNQGK